MEATLYIGEDTGDPQCKGKAKMDKEPYAKTSDGKKVKPHLHIFIRKPHKY